MKAFNYKAILLKLKKKKIFFFNLYFVCIREFRLFSLKRSEEKPKKNCESL